VGSSVANIGNNTSRGNNNIATSRKDKDKAEGMHNIEEENESISDKDDDDDLELDDVDDYVNPIYYRDMIEEGFAKRSPSRFSLPKPGYYPIDDPVLRSLTASKYSAKAIKYTITVANAFFSAITKVALNDNIEATTAGDSKTVVVYLNLVSNNMLAIEDMHRDRRLFLDLTSDPASSATERDCANNVLRHKLTPGVQTKGGSAKAIKVFAAY
jgi:hypothetical protein